MYSQHRGGDEERAKLNPDIVRILRWTELSSALFMTGLIWLVQVVHYPLMSKVGGDYVGYQAAHMTRITWVVAVPMLAEAAAGLALALFAVGPGWHRWPSTALLVVVWASTMFFQVPLHDTLTKGFDAGVHARLVGTNWIRTLGWTARAALAVAAMVRVPP